MVAAKSSEGRAGADVGAFRDVCEYAKTPKSNPPKTTILDLIIIGTS
jgi:hypothetical protein